MTETFVVAGAGLAGARAVETLREEGFEGRLVLVGDEPDRPYERPPLSKDYLRGDAERETIYVHPEAFYAEHDVELRLGRRAVDLNVGESELVLDDGECVTYDRLLLATGAEPRRLAIPGAERDGVLYLRTVADCDVLRERVNRGGALVVVGAGWIGCEVAASARARGVDVTIVAPEAVPLECVLGPELGAVYRDIHLDHGVQMRLGAGLEAFEGADAVERVRTSAGDAIDCDFVVVGIGVQPRSRIAAHAGIATGDGILVDEHLRTDAPDVFAAGDVASVQHPFYGERIRVEHWDSAREQCPAAALNRLGRELPYARLPYFFSDQYEIGMEYTGHPRASDRLIVRGDPA